MAPEPKPTPQNPPELLLPPPLNRDGRSRAFTAAADRLLEIDRSVLLVMMVDLAAPEVLPYLARHFGLLGPPWRYLKTDAARRKAIKEAIYWHRVKGSPAGVELALSWAGHSAGVEDLGGSPLRWAEYELCFDDFDLNTPDKVAEVVELADFASPARAHLRRLHNDYDRRPIILDHGPELDFGMLDDDSGVWDAESGVKLSFGNNKFIGLAPYLSNDGPWPWLAHTSAFSLFCRYVDKIILDRWRLDSEMVKDHGVVASQLVSLTTHPRGRTFWTGAWDDRKIGLPGARYSLRLAREISKSQLALDGVRLDCCLHTLDRSHANIITNPLRTDSSRLDSHDIQRMNVGIDERFVESATLFSRWERGGEVACASWAKGFMFAECLSEERGWGGYWDSRLWAERRTFITSTTTATTED